MCNFNFINDWFSITNPHYDIVFKISLYATKINSFTITRFKLFKGICPKWTMSLPKLPTVQTVDYQEHAHMCLRLQQYSCAKNLFIMVGISLKNIIWNEFFLVTTLLCTNKLDVTARQYFFDWRYHRSSIFGSKR